MYDPFKPIMFALSIYIYYIHTFSCLLVRYVGFERLAYLKVVLLASEKYEVSLVVQVEYPEKDILYLF